MTKGRRQFDSIITFSNDKYSLRPDEPQFIKLLAPHSHLIETTSSRNVFREKFQFDFHFMKMTIISRRS